MLVLSRKVGETLTIGDDIKITFLSQKKKRIRVGIEAPKNMIIKRNEIYKKTKCETLMVSEDVHPYLM